MRRRTSPPPPQLTSRIKRLPLDLEKQWGESEGPLQTAAEGVAKDATKNIALLIKQIQEETVAEEKRFAEQEKEDHEAFQKNATGEKQKVDDAMGSAWSEMKTLKRTMDDAMGSAWSEMKTLK